jgi:Transglycosylase SLT domain
MGQQPSAPYQGPSPEIEPAVSQAARAGGPAGQPRPQAHIILSWRRRWHPIVGKLLIAALVSGWCGGFGAYWIWDHFSSHLAFNDPDRIEAVEIRTVVEQIIKVESDGNPNAKNKRSSATGLAQFLDETWLRLVRTHRPDLVIEHSESEILELRRDADLAREIAARFTEGNAEMLRRRGLPLTPGTLYLAHFAGSAGAVAILLADEQADAASTMASADASGRTTREQLVRANPFLERLTVADLKTWADRKMRVRPL